MAHAGLGPPAHGGVLTPEQRPPVAIAHDYLTQRGGAERVVLALASSYPGADIWTTLYDPAGTFPEFSERRIRTSALDRVPGLRGHHRAALPLLAAAASSLRIDAEVTLCSSTGWAHGVRVTGRKVVYCHSPARWLYQTDRYLAGMPPVARPVLGAIAPGLRSWDRRAAEGADRYLVNSRAVLDRVRREYHRDAEVLPPPVPVDVSGPVAAVDGLEPGFVLSVGRLLAYKNVDAVVEAVRRLPRLRLVVVGGGPSAARLRAVAPPNVTFAGEVDDATLRWLYRNCAGLVSASFEDFGLTPIEAAAYGKPSAVLRFGGFLDTVVDGETGCFFERPDPAAIAGALRRLAGGAFDPRRLTAHAAQYGMARFVERVRAVVDEERGALALGGVSSRR